MLSVCVPLLSAVSAGRLAFVSVPVIRTVSLTLLTRFQFASTALTVMLKALPAVRALGVPPLPEAVPGAAVSPGTRSWSFTNAAGLTVSADETADALLPSVLSVAVTV